MDYTPEQFFRLTDMIQEQGGVQVDELCDTRGYELTGPKGKQPGKKLYIAGCGHYAIFSLPYIGQDGKKGEVKLCASCDDLGQTPRFAACMEP